MITENEVRELFQAAAGWKGLAQLLAFYELPRAAAFCARRARAVDQRAVELLHQVYDRVARMAD